MSLMGKMNQKTEDRRVRSNHPILALDVDRNVRDAYFDGIIFSAVVDDEQVDDSERAYLSKVALSLGIPNKEAEERIQNFLKLDSDGKIACGEELAETLKGCAGADILLCEFSLVWMSHGHDASELDEFRKRFAEWMDVRYDETFYALFDDVSEKVKTDPKAIYALRDYLDDKVIRYLFADIFEIEKIFAEKREEEERTVLPHPLKNVLDEAQKARHLNAVCRAVNEAGDNSPTGLQQKGLRHLAIALGIKNDQPVTMEPQTETVDAFSSGTDNRRLAFFLYCDMARIFAMDGHPAFSAIQTQLLDDVVTSMNLVPEDAAFLKEYSAFVGNGKEPNAAEVVQRAQNSIRFPDGFIRYFTPNMKPIALVGGDTAPGAYQIVDGHYRLEKPLKVGPQTRLVIKNAVIDFAPEAVIELNDCATEISGSTFNGEKPKNNAKITENGAKPFFSGQSAYKVEFDDCRFDGLDCRSGINVSGHETSINLCQFKRLIGEVMIGWCDDNPKVVKCRQSSWADCTASREFCGGESVFMSACDFENCSSSYLFACHGYKERAEVKACLFVNYNSKGPCWVRDGDGFRNTYMGGPYSSFEFNHGSNSDGLDYIISNVTLDKMREARVKIDKGED